ncbi:hypothetical protein B0T21DRAFT_166588 [Apiosordaria backusii]|uniref:Uncharacterized protein n=1 Tax=Apiosordaria backusii TaxID=314023 RepID=A0AA40EDJ8_9PEZI|nr:hypothetical protein B0T21DRAFT_166588 [Apiosordaria backusii]
MGRKSHRAHRRAACLFPTSRPSFDLWVPPCFMLCRAIATYLSRGNHLIFHRIVLLSPEASNCSAESAGYVHDWVTSPQACSAPSTILFATRKLAGRMTDLNQAPVRRASHTVDSGISRKTSIGALLAFLPYQLVHHPHAAQSTVGEGERPLFFQRQSRHPPRSRQLVKCTRAQYISPHKRWTGTQCGSNGHPGITLQYLIVC